MNSIELKKIRFGYGPTTAIRDISLFIPEGSIYGLLGENGAGKSTLLKLISGLQRPQGGEVRVLGKSLGQHNRSLYEGVGLVLEAARLYHHLTGRQHLQVFARYRGLRSDRIEWVLHEMGLYQVANKRVATYTSDMKQRLAIATALLPNPALLLLDEPSSNLDPAAIISLRRLLQRINDQFRTTIVISSQALSEMEELCSHVGIVHRGQLLYDGSIAGLRQNHEDHHNLWLQCSAPGRAAELLRENFFVVEDTGTALSVRLHTETDTQRISELLRHAGIQLYQMKYEDWKLEDTYLSLIQKAEASA